MSRWSRQSVSVSVAAAVVLLAIGAITAMGALTRPLDTLVQSERAFSAMSVEKGMRDAFVTFLDDQGVIFRPLPVEGKKLWAARDSVPGTLVWEPSFAEVAGSGDFGYTTGPWEYHPSGVPPDSGVSHGHFISVWHKQGDGPWRVLADIGVQHDKPNRGVGSGDLTEGPLAAARKADAHADPIDVEALERRLSDAMFDKGISAAFMATATQDFRMNRDGFLPTLGLEPARAAFDSVKGALRYEPKGTAVATSRDLAYSYGLTRWFAKGAAAPADSGVYLHVWRGEGGGKKWKLALAVENPL